MEGQRAAKRGVEGLEHLQNLAQQHQMNDKIRVAQRQQLEQLQGKVGLHLGGRKNSKFGDMIQMIKMAQAREEVTNQLLASCVITSGKYDGAQMGPSMPHAMNTASPLKGFQNNMIGPKGAVTLHQSISPNKPSIKQTMQQASNQTLGAFGQGQQQNQNLLSMVAGEGSQERKQYFNHIQMNQGQENWTQGRKQIAQTGNIPKNAYQGNGNFASLQLTQEQDLQARPKQGQLTDKFKAKSPSNQSKDGPTPQKYVSLATGFDKIASAAYGSSNDVASLFPEDFPPNWKDTVKRSPQANGMNIKTFQGSQASPMDQYTLARLQGLQNQTKHNGPKYHQGKTQGPLAGRTSPSVAEGLNQYQNNGLIFLQGQKKVQHALDPANSSFHKRISPVINKDQKTDDLSREPFENTHDDQEKSRKVNTQPVSHLQLPAATQSERNFDTALVIRPDKINFQDQRHETDNLTIPKAPRTVAQKYSKETPVKPRHQAKSQIPQTVYIQQHDIEKSQGQQSLDLEYLARKQNEQLLKTESKAKQQRIQGLEYLGSSPDGKNHYNYKLKLFGKKGQLTVKNERQNQIYDNQEALRHKSSDIQASKTNSTANSERFRIAALRDSRRGSLYTNEAGQRVNQMPFALGSSFQAAGQQALFGNIGSSQNNQNRGETLPLHRHSIGPGVVTDNKQSNDQNPKLDSNGNSFYPEPKIENNRKLLQATFATPQQKTSDKLHGAEIEYTTKISKGQTAMIQHPSMLTTNPYQSGMTNQSIDQNAIHRNNTSSSRKNLLVPVLSNNNSQQNLQMMGVNHANQSGVGIANASENPQYKKQKQASNAIIQQANQILQQVTRNTSQYKDTLQFSANGQAVLGGMAPRRNPIIQVNMQSESPEQQDKVANSRQIYPHDPSWSNPMVGNSYDQGNNSLKIPIENSIHSNNKHYKVENSEGQSGSMRLHERVQRSGQTPQKQSDPELQLSPKAIRRPRNISQYDAYQLSGQDDIKNQSFNSHKQGMINVFQHAPIPIVDAGHSQKQPIRGRQLINKHKNINFANF